MRSRNSSACSARPTSRSTRASVLLERAVEPLGVEGRALFAGLRSWWDDPTDPWTRLFHLGDMLRECRGDAHISSWSSAALDAVEIGLLNDLYMGMPLQSYVRTRGWNDDELAGGRGAPARPRLARRRRAQRRGSRGARGDRARDRSADGARARRAWATTSTSWSGCSSRGVPRCARSAATSAGRSTSGPIATTDSRWLRVPGRSDRAVGVVRVPRPSEHHGHARQDARAHPRRRDLAPRDVRARRGEHPRRPRAARVARAGRGHARVRRCARRRSRRRSARSSSATRRSCSGGARGCAAGRSRSTRRRPRPTIDRDARRAAAVVRQRAAA